LQSKYRKIPKSNEQKITNGKLNLQQRRHLLSKIGAAGLPCLPEVEAEEKTLIREREVIEPKEAHGWNQTKFEILLTFCLWTQQGQFLALLPPQIAAHQGLLALHQCLQHQNAQNYHQKMSLLKNYSIATQKRKGIKERK
jgi:hypothetical protein